MNTVKIEKNKLLDQLQQNMDEHKFIYEKALEGWKNQVTIALQDAHEKALKGEEFITEIDLDEPNCHLEDYQMVIERVRWHSDDFIELDIREFNQFILDKWDWQYNFLATSSSYSSSSSSSSSVSTMIERKMKNTRGMF